MNNDEIEKLDFSDWPLPDKYLIEIGRVSATWVNLENFLGICIGKLAGFDEVTDAKPFILIRHSSVPQKLDILSALCEKLEREHQRLAKYKEVVAKLKSAQISRNKFLHNTIGPDPDSKKMIIAQGSARGRLKTSLEEVNIADIRRATLEIDEAFLALYKLIFDREIKPLRERMRSGQ